MIGLICTHRCGLWYELFSILTVIVCPTVYFRYFACPVTMARADRCCPFQRGRTPWILRGHFPSFKNGIEEIEQEQQLHCKHDHCNGTDKAVQLYKVFEAFPYAVVVITTRHTG